MKRFAVILSIALALPALAASYSSGSRSSGSSRSYSSGSSSKSYSSGSKSYSSGSSSKSYSSGSKSYSSGSSKPSSPPKSYSSPSTSASKAMKMQESQRSYSSYKQKVAPASAPNNSSYSTRSYSTRGYSDPDYWSKRKERERRVFGNQPQTTVVHNYSDGISPMFWGFMMGQSLNNQAAWAYHHRDSMDDARYRELLARDAALEAKVKAMEAEGVQRDPNYLPEGVDEDLVYSKPKPEPKVSSPQSQEELTAPEKEDDGTGFFTWLLVLTGIGGAGYAAYYFGFKKKYSF